MIQHTFFPNAPIVEALLDIRVELPKEVTVETLDRFHGAISARFPEKRVHVSGSVALEFSAEGPRVEHPHQRIEGYFFRSPQENKVVQVRMDGYTFHKLKPYETWKALCAEARVFWDMYRETTRPLRVTRIGLRYINRIEIPLPFKDFKEYVSIVPEIPNALPQGLESFFMHLVIPKPGTGMTAVVVETIEKLRDDRKLPLILDINAFCDVTCGSNESQMWTEFEELCAFKNDIFFGSLTDKAKELFK